MSEGGIVEAKKQSSPNRSIIVSIIAVAVVATAIAIVTWPVVPSLNSYSYGDAANGEYRPGGSPCTPESLAAIRNVRKRESKADACADKAEEYRQNTSDLIQQTRAADAAEAQANIASQGLWTAWFQTIGGFITLAAAVAAAVFARDAAKESRRSADAAHNAHRESELANAMQFPPDIYVTNAAIWTKDAEGFPAPRMEPSEKIAARIWVVNAGREDAIIKFGHTHCQTFWWQENLPMRRPYDGIPHGESLAANRNGHGSLQSGHTDGWEMETVVPDNYSPNLFLYIMGYVTYHDRFDKRRIVLFCRRYDPERQTFEAVERYPDYEAREPKE